MAHSHGYIPRKDAEFIAWAKTIYQDCSEHADIWQLDMTVVNQLNDLIQTADSAYQHNTNLELRNRASTSLKGATFTALRSFLSMFINTLEGNPNVPDEAIESMGLRPRHQHSHQPIPVPTEAPMLMAVVGQHHEVTVYVSTLQHGHPTEHLKDERYTGFILKYLVDGETQWQSVVSTKLHYMLIFTDAEEGKHIRLQAASNCVFVKGVFCLIFYIFILFFR
jgi:hypothetical protein